MMTRSEELFKKAVTLIPGGVNSPVRAFGSVGSTPRFIEQANGVYMTDVDGNKYLDFYRFLGTDDPRTQPSGDQRSRDQSM